MILVILLISLVLRLISINQSLWLDEAININNAANLDFPTLIFKYSLGDFHPPLYHLLLKSWISTFGLSEISARAPSILLGVACVFFIYLIGRKLYDKKTALSAAILLATSPLAIYYSQEARMYMLAAFLTTASVYFFISILKKSNFFIWLGFIGSTTLLLYTDYLPYLMILLYILFLLVERKRIAKITLGTFIPAFLLIFIFAIPWFLVFPKQLSVGLSAAAASPAWAQVVGSPSLQSLFITFVKFTIGRISHDNNFLYALFLLPVAFIFACVFSLSLFRLSRLRSFLWYWFLGPIFVAFFLAFFVPIFAYFRFLFVLPAFYLIAASGINTINWAVSVRTLLILVLAVNLVSSSIYLTNPKFQREDWRSAVSYIHQNSDSQTLVIFESNSTVAPFDYYNKGKVAAQGVLSSYTADESSVGQNLEKLAQGKNKIFLSQYLSEITDPTGIVSQKLFNLGYINQSTKDFPGVGFVYEFKRQ